jgi:drug/metabolite transporter (DMT)-like permease
MALLGAVTIWGFVPTSSRYIVATLDPSHILLVRFLVGAAVAAVALGAFGAPRPRRELLGRAVFFGLLGQLGFNVPLAYGIKHVEAGTAALINATSPVFIAPLAAVMLRERVPLRVIAGLLVALGGSVVVAFVSGGQVAFTRDQALGSGLILLSAILWAFYSVLVKPWLGPIPPTSIPMIGSIVGLFIVLPLGASGFVSSMGELNAIGWLAVAQFTLLASVTAPILWAVGLQRGGATRSGVYLYIMPVVGVVASASLLDEAVGRWTLLGGLLVLAGVVLATVPPHLIRRRRIAPEAGRTS